MYRKKKICKKKSDKMFTSHPRMLRFGIRVNHHFNYYSKIELIKIDACMRLHLLKEIFNVQ